MRGSRSSEPSVLMGHLGVSAPSPGTRGIRASAVLVAEMTTKNSNVFYELGLAHAPEKLIDKLTDNVRSALGNPEDAIFRVDEAG